MCRSACWHIEKMARFQTLSDTQNGSTAFRFIRLAVLPLFYFVFVIIRFFRFRYTFYHVNDYGIKLCGVLRCNDWSPGILFNILSNLTGIAAATTGNLLTFRKSFRLMCFLTVLWLLPLQAYSEQFPSYSYYHGGFLFRPLISYIAE